jgi:hypothetical protein
MPVTIFHRERSSDEEWLEVNDDGTVCHHTENSGWRMTRKGLDKHDDVMSPDRAKALWPQYAADIDRALAQLAAKRPPSN